MLKSSDSGREGDNEIDQSTLSGDRVPCKWLGAKGYRVRGDYGRSGYGVDSFGNGSSDGVERWPAERSIMQLCVLNQKLHTGEKRGY